jgi:hypothetical protein
MKPITDSTVEELILQRPWLLAVFVFLVFFFFFFGLKMACAQALVAGTIAAPAQATSTATTPQVFPFIYVGQAADFNIVVTANGNVYVPPAGTTYAPVVTWTSTDPAARLTLSVDTQTVTVVLTSTDTATSITLTASCLAPDGKTTLTATYQIPILVAPVSYQLGIVQTRATGP